MENEVFNTHQVRRAAPGAFPLIKEILTATAVWLKEKGVNQWQHLLTDEEDAEIMDALDKGETYIIWKGNDPVATFNLNMTPSAWDHSIWQDAVDEEAIYLHRLAVSRKYSGQNAGGFMIQWILRFMVQEGMKILRLDCVAQNTVLNNFYESQGFTFKGTSENDHSKYEQVVNSN